ncbi:MAG: DUF3662 domain-containing protein [Chloroflexi bacterium]|nr:DUF3662 domain-containing protein [Chloroflexota bacterium]
MRDPLLQLETKLKHWIEGSIEKLLTPNISPATLARHLALAMEQGLQADGNGIQRAPDTYQVFLHPQTLESLNSVAPELCEALSKGLNKIALGQGFRLAVVPQIKLLPDSSLSEREIIARAGHKTSPLDQTRGYRYDQIENKSSMPPGAFLIVDGGKHIALTKPVINIGRRSDNQVVLNKPQVSRIHAQIRLKQGRFVLFDVGSKSGTYVDGIPVKQHILQPGDVITIVNIPLVYGEEQEITPDETKRFPPVQPRKKTI